MSSANPSPILELTTLTLNGVRSFDRVESFCFLGEAVQHHPFSQCYHQAGIELLPDSEDTIVAYLFIFTRPRDTGQYCPNPFEPFTGLATFQGETIDVRDRSLLQQAFASHPKLFHPYESGESFFRYILVGDEQQRRIGFFYTDDGELDHILVN